MQGLLLVDKPAGMTSFAVVAKVRRLTHEKKVGHTGTLDPMATGVLPVLIGRATALSDYLSASDKAYSATVQLGVSTDTDDITGRVIRQTEPRVTGERLEQVLAAFRGNIRQVPPMFSALKRDGVALYKLARQGRSVPLEPRPVIIKRLELTEYDETAGRFKMDVVCSKGTYIRSLCRDIGEALGCGAAMAGLRRTATGGFGEHRCVLLDQLTEENIGTFVLDSEEAVKHLPILEVSEKQGLRFGNGGSLSEERLTLPDDTDGGLFRVKAGACLWGIGRYVREIHEVQVACVVTLPGQKGEDRL